MAFVIPKRLGKKRGLKQVVTFAGTLAFLFSNTWATAEVTLTSVADLRYGVALYNYYQNQNLEALTELLIAKERGGIKGHGDNPEIMEGGFCMAYGMERKAGEIFDRLLSSNRSERTRNAAWFNLAELRYLRKDWPSAQQALDKVSDKAEPQVALESTTLNINLAIQQDRLADAEALLKNKSLRNGQKWLPYLHFNIGSAYSRQGNFEKGIEYYTKLLTMRTAEPEFLGLYDKAMTATGYAYLLNKNHSAAAQYFSKVRMDSPLSSRALLGYGWAAAELGDYMLALKPWHALSERSLIDENTQEVLIAIPYAFEKMGHSGLALRGFQTAEASYQSEMSVLDDVIANVQTHSIHEALNIERSADINWLDYAEENQLSPHLSYLVKLFSEDEFVELVQELRDLLAIQAQFKIWQAKLNFYTDMLEEREQNRAQQLNFILEQGLDKKILALESKRNDFSRQILNLNQENDFLSLQDEESTAKLERILRSEKNAILLNRASSENNVQVMPDEELLDLVETLRKQKGLMIWRAQAMFDERLWRTEREISELDRQLTSIKQIQVRLQKIVDKNVDLQSFKTRISASEQRLIKQLSSVDQTVDKTQNYLRDKVIEVLRQQHARLKHYLAQSRLSIARILDTASADAEKAPLEHSVDNVESQQEGAAL